MVDLDNAVDGFVALGMLGVTAGVTKHIIDRSMPRRRRSTSTRKKRRTYSKQERIYRRRTRALINNWW